MSVRFCWIGGLACITVQAGTADAQPAESAKAISPVEFVELPRLGQAALSPDGEKMILIRSEVDWKKNRYDQQFQMVDVETGKVRDLPQWRGFDDDLDEGVWTPDSAGFITTLRRKKAKTDQAYYYDIASRELTKLTDHTSSVSQVQLMPDGSSFFFMAGRHDPEAEEREQWDIKPYDVSTPREIWFQDLTETKARPVLAGNYSVRSYSVSDDGNSIIHIRRPEGAGFASQHNEIWLHQLADGSNIRLTNNDYQEASPSLSPDNRQFAYIATVNEKGEGYYEDNLFIQDIGSSEPRLMLSNTALEIVDFAWDQTGEGIFLLGNSGVRTQLYRLAIQSGKLEQLTTGDHVIRSWHFDRKSGTHTAKVVNAGSPGDISVKRGPTGSFEQVTHEFDTLGERFKLPRQTVYSYKGRDGTSLEGLLVYPVNHQSGRQFPLVTTTHGGPRSSSQFGSWNMSRYISVLAGQGYGVFLPNHRGGTGYGDAFMRDMVGGYFNNAHLDVLDGIDALVGQGLADPDRLVKMGWSAGGHMTNKLITFTDRFKAASSGAGASDWVSLYGESDVRHNRTPWFGGSPWEEKAPLESYARQSLLKDAWKVKTPTLFFNGARDVRVPPTQEIMMYRGVRANGTPTELYLAPGEPHNYRKPKHQLFKMNKELAWYAKYVTGVAYEPVLPDVDIKEDKEPVEEMPEIPEEPIESAVPQEQTSGG